MCGGAQQGPGVPWWTQKRGPGSGWALAIPILGSWEGAGWVLPLPSQYPVYPPLVPTRPARVALPVPGTRGPLGTCTYDRFQEAIGDPRGRIRTGYAQASLNQPHASPNARLPSLPWSLGGL